MSVADVVQFLLLYISEMVKLSFNLALDRFELAAVLKEFDETMHEKSLIPSADFLKFFFRKGFEARDKARAEQRRRQLAMNAKAAEDAAKVEASLNMNNNVSIDYNFDEADEASATEKVRIAAMKYDKAAPGSVSLDGFECNALGAGEFQNLVLRVFQLNLSPGELGYIVQKYDVKKIGAVYCKTFLNEFLGLGVSERHKAHLEQLERQKRLDEEAHSEHLRKIEAVMKSQSVKVADEYDERHLKSVLKQLTEASVKFDKNKGGTLISFDPESLDALEFKKAIKRTFDLTFTPEEMAAAITYFDKKGEKKVCIFACLCVKSAHMVKACTIIGFSNYCALFLLLFRP
jgi:hypothetical protein